jgi:hypothetical protein
MNAWDDLPNANNIDFVIESVKKYPDEWVVARDATWYAASGAAYGAAKDAILSLVVYDDCEQYLDMSYNELLFMAKLTQIPATILLLPYAKAMELIKEKV